MLFIKVVVQMPSADRTLVCHQQPSFQQRCYPVDAWHYHMGGLWKGREDGLLKNISTQKEYVVSLQTINMQQRAWLNGPTVERIEAMHAAMGTCSSLIVELYNKPLATATQRFLLLILPSTYPLLKTTDVCLIDLHEAAEPRAPWPDHGASYLVDPRPRRLIATKTQNPLKPQRTGAKLLVGDVPHRHLPQPKGCLVAM